MVSTVNKFRRTGQAFALTEDNFPNTCELFTSAITYVTFELPDLCSKDFIVEAGA